MIRKILGIIIGYITILVLTFTTFIIVDMAFPYAFNQYEGLPTMGWAVFILIFSLIYAIIGGYVAAKIAKHKAYIAVFGLSAAVLVMGLHVLISNSSQLPLWYQIATMVIGVLGVLMGGKLSYYRRQSMVNVSQTL